MKAPKIRRIAAPHRHLASGARNQQRRDLHENLDAASISLTEDEIHAITALVPKDD